MFKNRTGAGEQLAVKLENFRHRPDTVVVAIPRGGLVPGEIIADRLELPLEVALVKKIGHPAHEEYAIGAVSLKNVTLEGGLHIPQEYIRTAIREKRKLLAERSALFYNNRQPMSLRGKTVILVDDGVATGNTLMAAIELTRQEKPESIIVAVPVGPKDVLHELESYADEVIYLENPDRFYAIGAFYEDFHQVSDEEAVLLFQAYQKSRTEQ